MKTEEWKEWKCLFKAQINNAFSLVQCLGNNEETVNWQNYVMVDWKTRLETEKV